jgi:hypothetical protein
MWESGGLVYKVEQACVKTKCPGVYGKSIYKGKEYYGRGYIQLVYLKRISRYNFEIII